MLELGLGYVRVEYVRVRDGLGMLGLGLEYVRVRVF